MIFFQDLTGMRHIQVNLLYGHLPASAGRVLSTAVDLAGTWFEVRRARRVPGLADASGVELPRTGGK